ncbi:MAG: hypothetical protein JFR24_03750 [Muribaculaceae bacterium]|jgi:hypothetical protein|nr:hypothetical protein [Muribaculaceae bacterium]
MKKIKRSTLIPLVLAVYLMVMASIGWGDYASGRTSALYYFGVIAITVVILILLHFSLRRRERYREERQADMDRNNDK